MVLLYQNCSSSNQFDGNNNPGANQSILDNSPDSVAQTPPGVTLDSGGDGYGGKFYEIISNSDACTDPNIPVAQIYIDDQNRAFLTIEACPGLPTPEPILVSFVDPGVIGYNGQFYGEVNSNILFDPLVQAKLVTNIEVEDFSRVPTSGGGVVNEWLRITDTDFASTSVDIPNNGRFWVVVRAQGNSDFEEPAKMALDIDGNRIKEFNAAEVPREYWFEVEATAGQHTFELHFTNDRHNSTTGQNRGLNLDYMILGEKPGVSQ